MANQYVLVLLFLLGMLVFLLAAMVLLLGYLVFTGRRLPWGRPHFFRGGKLYQEMMEKKLLKEGEEATVFCHHHPKEYAAGDCALCEENFCYKCLRQKDGLNFCPVHIKTYLDNTWVDLGEVHLNADNPLAGQHLYRLKYDLWHTHKRPALISTSYRIDVHGDNIESFVKIRIPQEDRDQTLKMIDQYKQKTSLPSHTLRAQ